MGLGFTIHTKNRNIDTFKQTVEQLAIDSGYHAEHDDLSSTVSFCKQGNLFLNYEQTENENTDGSTSVNGDCQTNLLGPGFHKAAIEFVDRLQQAADTRFEVEDETNYYTERDFEAMKKNHFHKWLAKLFEVIHEQKTKGDTALCMCWDIYNYSPPPKEGVVISPLGSFCLDEVTSRIRIEGIEPFADEFFIWNNPEQDAHFHRGLALHAMWEDCYFMPSQRSEEDAQINGYIIKELETAASLDPSLPFPQKEYEELCRLHGCTPIPTEGMPSYETKFTIGYRRGIIHYKVGNIRFSLPGNYLRDMDEGTLVYYDGAAENWHTVRCTGYSIEGEPDYIDIEEEMIEEGTFEGGKYRLYDMGVAQDSDDEEPYPVYSCHALCQNQYTLFTFCASLLGELKKLSHEVISSLVAEQPFEPEKKKIIYTNEHMNDELIKQIAEWHEADKHQEIIDALEQIPETERDYETVSLLARAYNNIEKYAHAAELLESVREDGEEDDRWNFRMGYAQYYLDNYRDALHYFNKARELNPEDENTLSFIRQCNIFMPLAQRVEAFWEWFVENEEKLSGMMCAQSMEEADAFTEFISEGTNLISEDVHFNIGGDHEFTFSVEGWPDLFILYPYVISRMPESLKGKWKFFPFNQGKEGTSLAFRMDDTDIDIAKIKVNASYLENSNDFNIRYYDENLCALPEEKSDGIFHIILELTLGEGVSFKYIREVERGSGIEDGMIAMSELKQHIKETLKSHNQKFFENPKDLYTSYQLTPKESDELRFDVIVGSTCLDSIVADYYNDSTELFDHANSFGAQAMFIVFPNGNDDDGHQILKFRHDLEDRITDELLEPNHLGLITGGATGTAYSYIDLLVYDFLAFILKIRPLLEEYPAYSFYISDFIRNGNIHQLTEADNESIPDSKENAEAFFKQIEDWNDNGNYTKCIKALETNEESAEEQENKPGTFVGFALLSDKSWDKGKFIKDLKDQWDIEADEDDSNGTNDDTLVFNVGDMIAAVSLIPAPVPNGEAAECAKNNYMWPEAEKVAKAHKANIMVAVLGKEESLLERGKLYVKLLSVCCLQKNVTGIYTSGVVFQPRFYEGFSGMIKEGSLPIFNWIWFGLYRTEKGVSGYTYGMECFGKDEMEVLDVDAEPSEVRDFLASMVGYVLEYDVVLNDGETIGFSAEDKHKITRGKGVALPDKMTLKISYKSENDADGGPDFTDDTDEVMDDAEYHLESIGEKDLPVDAITAYNHLAIYLRWCMENDLMSEDFLEQFGDVVSNVKNDPTNKDLRGFIKDNLYGKLTRFLFNKQGRAFADYYYGNYYGANKTPFYPGDIDNHALDYFGPKRYHSGEFKEEAYLYIPFDEDYYQAMAQVISRRFVNWQGLHIDKETVERSELARAFMDYLDCECTYFPSMSDDDPIMSAYTYAQRLGVREGFIPVLVKVDEGLWENIIGNSDPDSESSDDYTFNRKRVNEFRRRLLEAPVMDGKSILDNLTGQDNDDIDEEMEDGYDNYRFASYWDTDAEMTYPLILARIPVREPWKIFAYLPFGNWNDCPGTPELMAVSKYWYEEYGAVPAAFTNDELEYELPVPIPEDRAMEAAIQQYAFCPDMDQNCDGIGSLADTLRQSRIWYFWWD